ncbi:hypothetical protein GCM10009000_034300 [Halobacterium noricense]
MQSHVDEDSSSEVTEMKDPESRTIFAGVDGRTDTELPEWYRERHGSDNPSASGLDPEVEGCKLG